MKACWSRLLWAWPGQAQIKEGGAERRYASPALPPDSYRLGSLRATCPLSAVALVVVGMEPLHQLLEAGLDVGLGRAVLEISSWRKHFRSARLRVRSGVPAAVLASRSGNSPNGS